MFDPRSNVRVPVGKEQEESLAGVLQVVGQDLSPRTPLLLGRFERVGPSAPPRQDILLHHLMESRGHGDAIPATNSIGASVRCPSTTATRRRASIRIMLTYNQASIRDLL